MDLIAKLFDNAIKSFSIYWNWNGNLSRMLWAQQEICRLLVRPSNLNWFQTFSIQSHEQSSMNERSRSSTTFPLNSKLLSPVLSIN